MKAAVGRVLERPTVGAVLTGDGMNLARGSGLTPANVADLKKALLRWVVGGGSERTP
jgi:hypothetical protein